MSGQSTLFKMDTFGTSTTDLVYPSYRDPNRVSYKEKQGPSQGVHLTEVFLIAITVFKITYSNNSGTKCNEDCYLSCGN